MKMGGKKLRPCRDFIRLLSLCFSEDGQRTRMSKGIDFLQF